MTTSPLLEIVHPLEQLALHPLELALQEVALQHSQVPEVQQTSGCAKAGSESARPPKTMRRVQMALTRIRTGLLIAPCSLVNEYVCERGKMPFP